MTNNTNVDKARESFELMHKLIDDTIFNISLNAQLKTDNDCADSIKNFIFLVSKHFSILNLIVNKSDQKLVKDRDFDSLMILWQGGNSLIGSMQLIRQGYTLEPQFLVRYAIENLAMVLSFYTNDKFYKRFQNHNLTGEKCIGEAKKLVSQIGQIYGLLSEITHPSKKTLGYIYLEGRDTLLVGGGILDSTLDRVKLNLAILNYITTIFWSSTELIYNEFLDELAFWQREKQTLIWKPSKDYEHVYSHSLKLFNEVLSQVTGGLGETRTTEQ